MLAKPASRDDRQIQLSLSPDQRPSPWWQRHAQAGNARTSAGALELMTMSTLDLIAAERRTIADELEGLTPEQLATPSLCGAWTVHDVAAHLIMPLTLGMGTVMAAMAASMGNFDKANIKLTAKVADRSISEIAAQLRAQAENKFTPPGMGFEAPLTDALVHGEDFRRPLGIEHQFDPEALRTSLGFVATKKGQRTFPGKGRLTALRFDAPDIGWSFGDGALIQGGAPDVLLAMCGRTIALDKLTGDGVSTLRTR
jgi:uncharacterized protein (TIGR03083 family)